MHNDFEWTMTTRGEFGSGIGGFQMFTFKVNKIMEFIWEWGRVVRPLTRGKGLCMFDIVTKTNKLR